MRSIFVWFLNIIFLFGSISLFSGNTYAQNQQAISKNTRKPKASVGRIITVGDHGQFKGSDGLQMALNMAQDMDEIRVETGTIKGSGYIIAENKVWEHGIKISGGWDEAFGIKSNHPEDTILDGVGVRDRIFTTSNKRVFIENLAFNNSVGGAVRGNATFTNCIFTNNSVDAPSGKGGAVSGDGTFYNCTFTSNSAVYYGGAVYGDGTFHNCTFANNSAANYGGAVMGNGTFHNCTFTNNSASRGGAVVGRGTFYNCIFTSNSAGNSDGYSGAVHTFDSVTGHFVISTFSNCMFINNSASIGGAIYGLANLTNCTFYGNRAKETGGAFEGVGRIFNSIFFKNTAAEKDNDITARGDLKIDYSLFNYLSGAADVGTNIVMGDPKFDDPDNGDLHLRSDSPCIGKGGRLSGLKDAKDMNTKPGGVSKAINMGADEAVLTLALKDYRRTFPRLIASDYGKLKRRLALSEVSAQDKQRFAISFMDAFGKDYDSNPYILELSGYLPKGYLSDSEYAEAKKTKEAKYEKEVLPFVTIDDKTRLMWVKDGKSAGCNNGARLDWLTAMVFCGGLTYAGYSDWRLPNKEELTGISVDKGLFDNTESDYYWTDAELDTTLAYTVYFGDGSVYSNYKTNYYYVRCVRAGP